ncbi:MAG: hypothetical protein JNL83_21305 [Myxococcales bacterium]|nr:hypothetical protein [Myxococcales bacterium]
MLQFWVLFLVAIGVAYVVAFARKGKVSMGMTSRREEISSPASPAEVFAALRLIGPPYTVDDVDASSNMLVLSSPVTLFSWGFLYPVLITPNGSGSKIVIGCGSKVFQLGPVVTNAHNKCVATVQAALSAAPARVVNG